MSLFIGGFNSAASIQSPSTVLSGALPQQDKGDIVSSNGNTFSLLKSSGNTGEVLSVDLNEPLGLKWITAGTVTGDCIPLTDKGAVNGVATLDASGKIPNSQIPPLAISSFQTTADSTSRDALTGIEEGDIVKTLDNGVSYIWTGTVWQQLSTEANNIKLKDLSDCAYPTQDPPGDDQMLTYKASQGGWINVDTVPQSVVTGLSTSLSNKQETSEKDQPNGYCGLNSNSKVDASKIEDIAQSQVTNLVNDLNVIGSDVRTSGRENMLRSIDGTTSIIDTGHNWFYEYVTNQKPTGTGASFWNDNSYAFPGNTVSTPITNNNTHYEGNLTILPPLVPDMNYMYLHAFTGIQTIKYDMGEIEYSAPAPAKIYMNEILISNGGVYDGRAEVYRIQLDRETIAQTLNINANTRISCEIINESPTGNLWFSLKLRAWKRIKVEEIDDVNITSLVDNQVLQYHLGSSEWRNETLALGEVNTASAPGSTGDYSLVMPKVGTDLQFRRLKQGNNVVISQFDASTIQLDGVPPGEINTASNVGTGEGQVFKQKSGVDLQLKKIKAGTNITVTNGTDDITLDVAAGFDPTVNPVKIGPGSGISSQGTNSVAIGINAGNNTQGNSCIAIGLDSGKSTQGNQSVSIGYLSGETTQASRAIAIGTAAGRTNQGSTAIAIGSNAGNTNQHANSMVFNATGGVLNTDGTSRLYIDPIRNSTNVNKLLYNATTKEITYDADSGGGETNTVSSVGGFGESLFKQKVGSDLQFKKLFAAGNVGLQLADGGDVVQITTSAEVNFGANVGTGLGKVYKQKVGESLEIKSIKAGTGITVTDQFEDVEISTSSEANTSSSAGGESLVLPKSGVNLPFKGLTAGTNITLTPGANDITINASGGGSTNLSGLTDTTIGTLAFGQNLRYDGVSSWENYKYIIETDPSATGSNIIKTHDYDTTLYGLKAGTNMTISQVGDDLVFDASGGGGGGGETNAFAEATREKDLNRGRATTFPFNQVGLPTEPLCHAYFSKNGRYLYGGFGGFFKMDLSDFSVTTTIVGQTVNSQGRPLSVLDTMERYWMYDLVANTIRYYDTINETLSSQITPTARTFDPNAVCFVDILRIDNDEYFMCCDRNASNPSNTALLIHTDTLVQTLLTFSVSMVVNAGVQKGNKYYFFQGTPTHGVLVYDLLTNVSTFFPSGYSGQINGNVCKNVPGRYIYQAPNNSATGLVSFDIETNRFKNFIGSFTAGSIYSSVYSPRDSRLYIGQWAGASDTNWYYFDLIEETLQSFPCALNGLGGGVVLPDGERLLLPCQGAIYNTSYVLDIGDGEGVRGKQVEMARTADLYLPPQDHVAITNPKLGMMLFSTNPAANKMLVWDGGQWVALY